MFLSLLIPVYGVEKYIERCAVSLFEQTLIDNIEYIFVNDCTKDRSMDILQSVIDRYPSRKKQITILQHSTNRGLAAARQTALDNAHGDYVLTVDSDDWLDLNACEQLFQKIDNVPCDILIFDYYIDYSQKRFICQQPIASSGVEYLELLFLGRLHGGTCFKLIKRELYLKNSVRYIEGLNMLEDISVMFRLFFFACQIEKLDVPLYHYYQGNSSSYTACISHSSQNNILQLLELINNFFTEHKPSVRLSIAFLVFQRRVYLLLLQSVNRFCVYKKYCKKLKEFDSQGNNDLSIAEKYVAFCCRYMPCFISFYFVFLFKFLKVLRYKFYNR